MVFRQVYIVVGHTTLMYYSEHDVHKNDLVLLETRSGLVPGRVSSFGQSINVNPFGESKKYRASKRIVENMTQKIVYEGEYINMAGVKTVLVQHLNSARKYSLATDLDLKTGDLVVFDCGAPATVGEFSMMSVGAVIDTEQDSTASKLWIVCKVDEAGYQQRKERIRKAEKLRGQLNEKKKQFQDLELLNLIAKNDPETKALLDEYMELVGK